MGGPGGAGARLFFVDLGGPAPGIAVRALMASGDVGLVSPGVAQPDPELTLLSPALCAKNDKNSEHSCFKNRRDSSNMDLPIELSSQVFDSYAAQFLAV